MVSQLKQAGCSNNEISVLFPDKRGTKEFAHEKNTKAPEGATTGGVSGGVLGRVFGWLVGIGGLAIPGLGPFVAAGAIDAALSGAVSDFELLHNRCENSVGGAGSSKQRNMPLFKH
jgi:hypothetical protein